MSKKILIIGVDGFIGNDLARAILNKTDFEVYGFDLYENRIADCMSHERFHFFKGDILKNPDWLKEHIKLCDVILPLVAIATPATYVKDPLRVFHLDFEANLAIIKMAAEYQKRIIFPSTSEVYGMCPDKVFDEETSHLVLGPINKERWIYSCSKQLLDRVIYAHGQHKNLDFTIFRPFNWIGPKQDDPKHPDARALPQFIGNIMRNEDIKLVGGGNQRRTFIYIDDAIDCLLRIVQNTNNAASGKIFNIGNPDNDHSIRELAELVVKHAKHCKKYAEVAQRTHIKEVCPQEHYGEGYQDVEHRVPSIKQAKTLLDWQPYTSMDEAIKKTVEYHLS